MNDIEMRLRKQAGEYSPQPSDAIHQRAVSAIERLEIAPSRSNVAAKASAAAAAFVVLVIGIVLFRSNDPESPTQVEGPNSAAALQRVSFSINDPTALMQRYFNHPLESEMKGLSRSVSQVAATVSGLLPAPAKETAPET